MPSAARRSAVADRPSDDRRAAPQSILRRALWASAAALCVVGFGEMGLTYGGYEIPFAGLASIYPEELAFFVWLVAFGVPATFCLARALDGSFLFDIAIVKPLRAALVRPRPLLVIVGLCCVAASLIFRKLVLLDQPIADDELAYDLIAKTLLEGGIVNPTPLDPPFIVNQFTLASAQIWFAKYPIGQGILLALGHLLGSVNLVMPLLGAVGVWLTYDIGCRILDARRAALACLLLLVSPQYLFTNATWLSQSSSMVCMLLAMSSVLRLRECGKLRWALLGGAALGLGFLVRPMPSAGFVVAVFASYVFDTPRPEWGAQRRIRTREIVVACMGPLAAIAVTLIVNLEQSGDILVSGYHQVHGGLGIAGVGEPGAIAGSIGSALVRQNFWLLGWPLGMVFVAFARIDRARVLFWGMLAAEYAYRAFVPKSVVATTGPIYVMEAVPLLCLATVDGMCVVATLLGRLGVRSPMRTVAAVAFAGTLVGAALFLPTQLKMIRRGALERVQVFQLIEQTGIPRVLVFANLLVYPHVRRTWAYFPPNPWPDLRDDVLFLRQPDGPNGYEQAEALWRSRFADRRAFILHVREEGPMLQELPVAPPDRRELLPTNLPR